MKSFFASAFAILGFSCCVLSSHAQDAYASVVQPTDATSASPADAPKSGATKVVHGVVQGREGALPGATVWLHGSRTIAVTNAEGEFELRVPADAKTVSLTYGYGGLHEEEVTLAPVQALGSLYLLRASGPAATAQRTK